MLKAAGYRVLIKVKELQKTTETGLILVFDEKLARAGMDIGTIVDIGEYAWNGKPWAKVGDRVIFAKHAGKFVCDPETNEEFLVINDEDVQVIVTNEEKK